MILFVVIIDFYLCIFSNVWNVSIEESRDAHVSLSVETSKCLSDGQHVIGRLKLHHGASVERSACDQSSLSYNTGFKVHNSFFVID